MYLKKKKYPIDVEELDQGLTVKRTRMWDWNPELTLRTILLFITLR